MTAFVAYDASMSGSRAERSALLAAAAAVLAGTAAPACGSGRAERAIALDPMHLASIEVRGEREVVVLDPEVLFHEAGQAFERRDFEAAAGKYELVVRHFPESRYGLVSRYNAGLALERGGRPVRAIPFFEGVVERAPSSKDAHDALFRLAACFEAEERWADAIAVLTRILRPEFPLLVEADRLEAFARRGHAQEKAGELALAERDYQEALTLYRRNLDDPRLHESRWVSLAQFRVGEIYRELFSAIHFRLPLERMSRDLEDKSNLFLKAQNAYLRGVRLHHPDFAVAAGYRLGALYEGFYDDMLSAEVPDDLTREEIEVYFEELRKKIRPLVVQAIDIYERNLKLGQRLGQSGEWFRKTEGSLARLKEILREESTREALGPSALGMDGPAN